MIFLIILSVLLFSYFLFDWYEGIVYKIVLVSLLGLCYLLPYHWMIPAFCTLLLVSMLIYANEKWYVSLIYVFTILIFGLVSPEIYYPIWLALAFIYFVYKYNQQYIILLVYLLLSALIYITNSNQIILFIITFLLVYILEKSEYSNKEKRMKFEEDVWTKYYDEMKLIYKDMRGFRHDLHNHLQVIGGYLNQENYDKAKAYVNVLNTENEHADELFKTGNLLVDAILNAKVDIAKRAHIEVTTECTLPSELNIKETDLVVIVGNALDNAIEACSSIEEDPWIRIYASIFKNQFYFSIMNSSTQEIESTTKFITTKRGDHGHGILRMKQVVDKYDGYFNINQEEGVFGLEVMIPLPLMRDI